MSQPLEQKVWERLKEVRFPGMTRDIVSFGFVDRVEVTGDSARVGLAITTQNAEAANQVRDAVEEALTGLDGVGKAEVTLHLIKPPPPGSGAQQAVSQAPNLIPNVRHVIAVASGKGGVGKSTVATNLAVRLAQLGHRTGIVDADIYGPSLPLMFGIHEKPVVEGNRIHPFEKHGVKLMSLGFILDTDTPVIWRGPMVMKAIEQLLGDVEWGALDFLVVDLPPGTGDAQLTLSQRVPLSGAVIVTTPQDIALIDARKGLAMFRKVNVPVLGIVENMASFVCPHCGEPTDIFKSGGGERTAELLQCSFLGSIPLDPAIVEGGDAGVPIVVAQPEGVHADAFRTVAEAAIAKVAELRMPGLTIS